MVVVVYGNLENLLSALSFTHFNPFSLLIETVDRSELSSYKVLKYDLDLAYTPFYFSRTLPLS